jgi:hypothetical protein
MLTHKEVKTLEDMSWGRFFYLMSLMVLFGVALIVASVFLQKYVTPYAITFFGRFN